MLKKIRIVLLTVLFLSPLAAPALMVLQLNLEQLTHLSATVFVGRCVSVRKETDSAGRPVQYVTFQVEEMIKGEPAEKITFKQLSDLGEDSPGAGIARNLPTYQAGEEMIVFLSSEGRLGLTAPVGLDQGKFSVLTKDTGKKTVVNGLQNKGLFIGWRQSPKMKSLSLTGHEKSLFKSNGGEIPYDDFVSLVKRLAAP